MKPPTVPLGVLALPASPDVGPRFALLDGSGVVVDQGEARTRIGCPRG